MLNIDRMTLRLPATMEARAAVVARLVAQQLGSAGFTADRSIDRLSVEAIEVDAAMTDEQLARRIATAIAEEVKR